MPTYAYACTACDHRFEVQQSFTDTALAECPKCEGRLRKLFNAVGIVFKGSGFYRTDSRGSSSSSSGSSGTSGSAKSSSDSGTTSAAPSSPATTSSSPDSSSSKPASSATSAA